MADGDELKLGELTIVVAVAIPSETVSVPVPDPVSTVTVAAVVELMDCDAFVVPETPESVNVVVPLTQWVFVPIKVSVTPDGWFA